jgi:putative ABC transport system permease protein
MKKAPFLVLRLSLQDLRHEWILTLCMILAIAAIIAPLLVLLGLKNGVINTLRDRLVQDPVNREIRPLQTLQLTEDWFAQWQKDARVAFVLPTILRGSSVMRIYHPEDEQKNAILDLVPTAEGDPLLLENGAAIPKAGEVVLSHQASVELNIALGATVTAEITRQRQNRRESEKLTFKVSGILDPRADSLPRLYAPFDLVVAVERYREGRAVPEYGWSGEDSQPTLEFSQALLITTQPLSAIQENQLTIGTGFGRSQSFSREAFAQQFGFSPPENLSLYRLESIGSTLQNSNLQRTSQRLRGVRHLLLPLLPEVTLILEKDGQKQHLSAIGWSLAAEEQALLGLPPLPWSNSNKGEALRQMAVPGVQDPETRTTVVITADGPHTLTFPAQTHSQNFSTKTLIPLELAAILLENQKVAIRFIPEQEQWLKETTLYRGFRLYAKRIEDVPSLYAEFSAKNIPVSTEIQAIARVQLLDQSLTKIFWLIVFVGIAGGAAALLASLYASVERKKRDIGILRLMGLHKMEVFRFPLYQSAVIATGAVFLASLGFLLLSQVLNQLFSEGLRMGEKISTLAPWYFIAAWLLTVAISNLSALLAAWRSTQIEPSEAIRDE